jgi:hypothetical protein
MILFTVTVANLAIYLALGSLFATWVFTVSADLPRNIWNAMVLTVGWPIWAVMVLLQSISQMGDDE